jgi:hypothetical protein
MQVAICVMRKSRIGERTLRLGGKTIEVIGLGAKARMANVELARGFAPSLDLAPLVRVQYNVAQQLVGMDKATMASYCGYQGDLSTYKLQNSHALVVRPLCRSAALHLEPHHVPLGASPYQRGNLPSVLLIDQCKSSQLD